MGGRLEWRSDISLGTFMQHSYNVYDCITIPVYTGCAIIVIYMYDNYIRSIVYSAIRLSLYCPVYMHTYYTIPQTDGTPKMPVEDTQNEVQILPSVYTIRKYKNFNLSYNDSTCMDISVNQQFANCWRSCGIPKLIDCDLGPDNVLTSNPSYRFYLLQNDNGWMFSHTWFAFRFSKEFHAKAVKIHYICISTEDTELNVNLQYYGGNQYIDLITFGGNIECPSSMNRTILMVGIQGNDPHRVIPPGDPIGLKIHLRSRIALYVSEVQFFKEGIINRGI